MKLRIEFSKGSVYEIHEKFIHHLCAKKVIIPATKLPFDMAIKHAEEYFNEDSDRLIEFASNGLEWADVILLIERRSSQNYFESKDIEWQSAEKSLVE